MYRVHHFNIKYFLFENISSLSQIESLFYDSIIVLLFFLLFVIFK